MTTFVSAVGMGRFGKRAETLIDLADEAAGYAREIVGDKPIDLVVVGSMIAHGPNGPEALGPRLAGRLGLEAAHGIRVDAASATGAMAFHAAVLALESGRYRRALVIAAEKMTDRPTPENTRDLSASLHFSEVAHGATMPALASMVAQAYTARHGVGPEAYDEFVVHERAEATRNANAHFQKPVTASEVAASRPVALPLRLLHCSAISDGAVALVIERGIGPATVLGLGQGFEALRLVDRVDMTTFAATRTAASQAYGAAHLTRKDVDVVEMHDAFAPFGLIHIEDLGLCGPGEAASWYARGWGKHDGRTPVNPSGGVIGRGHPVAASGLAEIGEIALQLREEAGSHSVSRRPRVGLAQAVGGLASQNFVTILGNGGP
ncbi:MAG: thiolase family protein [Thermoplasmata archaeon]